MLYLFFPVMSFVELVEHLFIDVQYCLQVSTRTLGFPICKDWLMGHQDFPMELDIPTCTMGVLNVHLNYNMYTSVHPVYWYIPWDIMTEVGCTNVPTMYNGIQRQKQGVQYSVSQILLCTPVCPVHLGHHGTQGQRWYVLVYHRYICVLLSVPSTYTMAQ